VFFVNGPDEGLGVLMDGLDERLRGACDTLAHFLSQSVLAACSIGRLYTQDRRHHSACRRSKHRTIPTKSSTSPAAWVLDFIPELVATSGLI
jgi:hypothetical protein